MATEKYYHDIDLVGVSQLKNARKQNVTQAEMDALALVLGAENKGLFVFNTDTEESSTWTGTEFKIDAPKVQGAMVYKGAISAPGSMPTDVLAGYTFVYTGPSTTLTWTDQVFAPDSSIETGDQIVYRGDGTWDIYDGSEELATESVAGIAKKSSIDETKAGTNTENFVTPAGVSAFVSHRKLTTVFFADNQSLTANIPLTISHNMNLQNKDAFTIRIADSSGNSINAQVQSQDVNSIVITSSVGLTGVKITIIGF
jgi:hypothetical protein